MRYTFAVCSGMGIAMLMDELLAYLFEGQPHMLATPLGTWLADSRRFMAFVNAFHTKIRKKMRATREPESLLDLRLELETAYWNSAGRSPLMARCTLMMVRLSWSRRRVSRNHRRGPSRMSSMEASILSLI
jgi:hypothetical protein